MRQNRRREPSWSKAKGDYFMSHEEIAQVLGIHRVTVVNIEKRALVKLAKCGRLKDFFDIH